MPEIRRKKIYITLIFGLKNQKPKNQSFWSMPGKLWFLVCSWKKQKKTKKKSFLVHVWKCLVFWFFLEKTKFPIHGPKNFVFLVFWFLQEKTKNQTFPDMDQKTLVFCFFGFSRKNKKPNISRHGPKNFGFLVFCFFLENENFPYGPKNVFFGFLDFVANYVGQRPLLISRGLCL